MGRLRDLEAGSVLGRYELVLRVATGGMGEIWAARLKGSRGFQKVVAVKTLLAELSHNPNFEQMFLDEAALASKIKHPNVVQVIDLGEQDSILYQVMEWVSGESLWSIMRAAAKRDGVPLPVAARIVCQVCSGLHAAHELKGEDGNPMELVHRDVSPQNILITAQGVAKVVDFGVAKYAGRGVAETKAGELRGKVPYMAPEHILGQPSDRRADVFALGLLMYQLVSGVHPFLEDDDRLTMARISSPLPAVPLRKRVPSVPEDVSQIVAAALAKSPKARTPSAVELMRALEGAIPSAAVQSSNELVADYLRDVVGEHLELRAQELRDALKRLDDDAPPAPVVPRPAAAGAPRTPAQGTPAVGGAADTVRPLSRAETPRGGIALRAAADTLPPKTPVTIPVPPPSDANEKTPGTEPSVSGVSLLSNASEIRDAGESLAPIVGWRASWIGRHPVIAGGAALALVVVAIVGLGAAAGSSTPAPVPATPELDSTVPFDSRKRLEPQTTAAPPTERQAVAPAETPPDPTTTKLPPEPPRATAAAPGPTPHTTKTAAPAAPSPPPATAAPAAPPPTKPAPSGKPKEFTPKGL